jgi:hypothetical protein
MVELTAEPLEPHELVITMLGGCVLRRRSGAPKEMR